MSASAAEVFIAALSQNQRATTIGTTTFGKGTVQDIIALSDGSALHLTTGYIQTPDGTLYHQQGLKPTYSLAPIPAKTADYVAKTMALIERKTARSSPSGSAEKPATADTLVPRQSQPLHIQTTLNAPNSSTAAAPHLRLILLCFDKDFDSGHNAEVWSMEVRASLREKLDHYLIQYTNSDAIRFMVCLGPFKNKEEAEKNARLSLTLCKHLYSLKRWKKPLPNNSGITGTNRGSDSKRAGKGSVWDGCCWRIRGCRRYWDLFGMRVYV